MEKKKIISVALTILITAALCTVLGAAFYGSAFFDTGKSTFRLLTYGASAAFIFSMFYHGNVRIGLMSVIALFLLTVIVSFDTISKAYLVTLLYFAAIAGSAYVHSEIIFKSMTIDKFIRPLLLSGFFTITFGVAAIISLLVYATGASILRFIPEAGLGTITGLCVGVGIEWANIAAGKIVKE